MNIPPKIERVLGLANDIFVYYLSTKQQADDREIPPPPEEAQLRAHLMALTYADVYMCIVACDIGRGISDPKSYFPAFLAVSGLYPLFSQGVDQLMQYRMFLANFLRDGLSRLNHAGVDPASLFYPDMPRKNRQSESLDDRLKP